MACEASKHKETLLCRVFTNVWKEIGRVAEYWYKARLQKLHALEKAVGLTASPEKVQTTRRSVPADKVLRGVILKVLPRAGKLFIVPDRVIPKLWCMLEEALGSSEDV